MKNKGSHIFNLYKKLYREKHYPLERYEEGKEDGNKEHNIGICGSGSYLAESLGSMNSPFSEKRCVLNGGLNGSGIVSMPQSPPLQTTGGTPHNLAFGLGGRETREEGVNSRPKGRSERLNSTAPIPARLLGGPGGGGVGGRGNIPDIPDNHAGGGYSNVLGDNISRRGVANNFLFQKNRQTFIQPKLLDLSAIPDPYLH